MSFTFFRQQFQRDIRFVFVIVIVIFFGCQFQEKDRAGSTTYASLNDSTAYVGMATCRQCHTEIYNSYIQTGMGQSYGLARPEKSASIFDSHSLVLDTVKGYRYHPFWIGDSLHVLEFMLSGKDTSFKRQELVSYIVGSGQHTNSHIRSVNNYLYQVPLTYYTQKEKWDLPPGFEAGFNSRFNRKIELECMSCHNAMPELVAGSENKYITVPNGIDCERCHGPGSRHVAEMSSGIRVDTSRYIDYSIVNPSKLPIDLQMDVCQRCHIQGNAVLNEGKSFTDFRPGMSLSGVMNVFMPVYKGDPDAHIMASHAERLKMSACFIGSMESSLRADQKNTLRPYQNALTCITCHNPHVSVKQTGKEIFNNACNSCHSPQVIFTNDKKDVKSKAGFCTETESKRLLQKNNCVSCHMPKNGTIDIPHVVTTDHYIRKPIPVKEINKIREFIGLLCINNPAVDSITRAKAFISYFEKFSSNPAFLDSAKRFISDLTISDRRKHYKVLIHWAYLKGEYAQVIKYTNEVWGETGFTGKSSSDNSDAWTAYRIGQSYLDSGDLKRALLYFRNSVDLAPYQPDFRSKLTSAQHDAKQIKSAVENYKFIISENPDYVPAYTNYGYLLLSEYNDVKGAEQMYNAALALDPLNEQAQLNKVGILVYQNKLSEAKLLLRNFMKSYPDNQQASDLYRHLGRQNAKK